MSRERDLKKLKKSLYQTQGILNDLITETGAELEQKWDETRTDTGKRLEKAGKKLEKNYGQARSSLNNIIKDTSSDVEKKYAQSKKEAEKTYNKTRKEAGKTYEKTRADVKDNYKDLRSETMKRLAVLKDNANVRAGDLKIRTADLLQGLAAGVLSFRNKLNPDKRLALRDEREKHHLGKMGYAKRFVALAIIIISKKDQLMNLGQQIYQKLQDRDAQQAFKNEAREQLDTMRRLVKAIANGHYKEFPYMSLVKIVAGILYFVSVADLIPDFIPILGLTDDLAVLAWIYASVKDDLQQFVDWEAANEHRREKMESQKSGAKSTSVSDRDASPNAASSRGTATGTTATAATGTTTARVNPGGGTTSSGAGAASGSTGSSSGTSSGGSTSTGSTTGGSTTNTSGSTGSSSGSSSDRNSGSNSGSGPKGSSGSSSGGSSSGGGSSSSGGSSSGGGSNSNKR